MTSSKFVIRRSGPDPDGDFVVALLKAAHDLQFCVTVSDGQSCLLYRSGDYVDVLNSMPVLGCRILTFSHSLRAGEIVGSISLYFSGDLRFLSVSTDSLLINQLFTDAKFPVEVVA